MEWQLYSTECLLQQHIIIWSEINLTKPGFFIKISQAFAIEDREMSGINKER